MKSSYFYLLIWLVVCVAAFVGYGIWYATVANESSTVAGLQNQIDAKTQASVRLAATRSALAEISGDESLVQGYFVPETSVVSFIDGLEALASAQKAEMKVLSVSTGGTAAQSNLVLLLTVSIDGSFDALMRTVGAIEYAPYDLSVSKLSVTQNSKNEWHADLELVVGSVPTSQADGTAAAPLTASSSNTTP